MTETIHEREAALLPVTQADRIAALDNARTETDRLVAAAVAREREACAILCEEFGDDPVSFGPARITRRMVAAAIRARGDA